jgi:hypothetical protein
MCCSQRMDESQVQDVRLRHDDDDTNGTTPCYTVRSPVHVYIRI